MIKPNAEHIIRVFFKRLRRYAGEIKKEGSAKAIHLFRVEIKKLRAFLRLLSLGLKKEDALKLPPKIKKMYRYAGKVRDRQLHYKRMKAAIKKKRTTFRGNKNGMERCCREKKEKGKYMAFRQRFFSSRTEVEKEFTK